MKSKQEVIKAICYYAKTVSKHSNQFLKGATKPMNKTNYFYSEIEDKVIVDFVNNDFKNRQISRRPYELAWELNMNFYLGNQYCFISSTSELSDSEKQYSWENREVFNHISPIIETRLAKLGKVKPTLSVKPNSNSSKDIYSAKLSKNILQNTLDKNNVDKLISIATAWSEITGTSFYKITWDTSLGETIGKDNDNEIKNGDIVISVCLPFEIYPDSNSAYDINDCESIIEARAYPVKYVNEHWGLELEGEDIDIFELNNNTFLSGSSGRSNISKIAHSAKSDHVLLIERYEKPSINRKNGRLTIVCKDKLLYDGDLPYSLGTNGEKAFPFIKQVSTSQLGSFWGVSVIERSIPIQRAYNTIKNKKHEFIARLASGVLAVEDGSVDTDNLETEGLAPGKILVYRNGSTPPEFLNPGTIPSELEKEEASLLSEINSLCCVSDLSTNSSIPGNITSGSALTLLIEQDESRLSLTAEHIRNSIKEIGRFILRLFKQMATEIRLNKIVDENGTLEVFYWTKSDLTSDDIILDTENELEVSESNKRELILNLIQLGLLDSEDGKLSASTKSKIFDLLGLKNWNSFEEISELHKNRANKENMELEILSDPLEIDDHKLHINEHIKFLISDSSKNISDDFKNKLLAHINKHKSYIN